MACNQLPGKENRAPPSSADLEQKTENITLNSLENGSSDQSNGGGRPSHVQTAGNPPTPQQPCRPHVDPEAPEFVEGWSMVQTLGEGAYGEVKLLINKESGEAVALKMVDLSRHPDAESCVHKEMLIHKSLKHNNVLKFFGFRREGPMQYMFLEYAVGGELFDRIEPDRGMSVYQAKKYFRELISGVSYLHSRGVTHRDLKPENLLLDGSDTLKISDFGLATLFRHNGKERLLNRRCGTKPYMPPEVLVDEEYKAQPADLWSCGIVLVTLLAGELPWDEPSPTYTEFQQWLRKDSSCFSLAPWTKLNTGVLAFLRRLLCPDPPRRLTLPQIESHAWYKEEETGPPQVVAVRQPTAAVVDCATNGTTSIASPPCKRLRSDFPDEVSSASSGSTGDQPPPLLSEEDDQQHRVSCSQPTAFSSHEPTAASDLNTDQLCFSQPAKPDHMLLAATQGDDAASPLQRLVRRLTRVLVTSTVHDTTAELHKLLADLRCTTTVHSSNILTVTTVDRRGAPLVMKISLYNMASKVLVDFRLSKGCGLDFKRRFVQIKEALDALNITVPLNADYTQWGQ